MMPPQFIEERLKVVRQFCDRIAQPDVLTAHQAWLYSRNVRHQLKSQDIQWSSELSSEQIKDVQRLFHASLIAKECGDRIIHKQCMLRAAQILEWLSNTEDSTKTTIPIEYMSAAAYQLAGLPAMAMNTNFNSEDLVAQILANFLKTNLNWVPFLAAKYWNNQMNSPTESNNLKVSNIDEMLRAIGIISSFLTTGKNDRLSNAIEKLDALVITSAEEIDAYEWLLCFLIKEVAYKYVDDSIWMVLQCLEPTVSDDGWAKLQQFAQHSCMRNRPLLWSSQKIGVERLASMDSFVMCTPTGSGKTTVAHLAVLQTLFSTISQSDDSEITPLVIYLVPSRALAAEAEYRLEQSIRPIAEEIIVTGLYGGTDWSITDTWLTSESPTVLVCTVEKAEAIIRYLGSLLFKRLSLIIIDEAHQVGFAPTNFNLARLRKGESREQRLEAFISRLLINCPMCRVVALSAVAEGIDEIIAKWITGKADAQPIGGNYRSTRQFIGTLTYYPHGQARILLEILDGKKLQLQDRPNDAFVPLGIPAPPQLKSLIRNSLYKYNECYAFWVAAHFAKAGKRVLISITEKIEITLKAICEGIEEWNGTGILDFFSIKDLTKQKNHLFERCLTACKDYCGTNSMETILLQYGVTVHHGQMPIKVRRLMTEVIEKGITPITIATSTLTEGVNLPFDIILLPRVVREPFDNVSKRHTTAYMPRSEFLNLAGRAGRPGFGSEGMTLIIVPESPSTTAKGQRKIQTEQVNKLKLQCQETLKTLVGQGKNKIESSLRNLIYAIYDQWTIFSGTKDLDVFGDWLEKTVDCEKGVSKELAETLDIFDEFLLCALHEVEELREISLSTENVEQILSDLWRKTFAYASTQKNSHIYERIMQRRGVAITENIIPEKENRHRIYRLGLPPQKAIRFQPFRIAIEQHLKDGSEYANWKYNKQYTYIKDALEIVADSNDFGFSSRSSQIPVSFWPHILAWWLCVPNSEPPSPTNLKDWLEFCSSNFEFKFGAAIGATITDIWTECSEPGEVPSLKNWEDVMGLPWIGFWIRELLRWGTLDPFIAYMLSRGHADSRKEAKLLKTEYEKWYTDQEESDDVNNLISPIKFREWEKHHFSQVESLKRLSKTWATHIVLDGKIPRKLRVFPSQDQKQVIWFDAAGYLVAVSEGQLGLSDSQIVDRIFWLNSESSKVKGYK